MAYLEKEQSLLSLSSYDTAKDPERRIRTAMGYGCPDTSVCATEYFGFANQVNWAAYQLQFNFNLSSTGNKLVAPYIVNKTITTLDEYNVFLTNAATAANYRYTPHVYWGNYNLWAIMVSNGWGVDSATYSKADLDAKNLVNKDTLVNVATTSVSYDQAKNALTTAYQIGQVSDDIKLVQTFLRQEGYYMNREITGLYGVITDQALQNYIRDKKLGITSKDNAERCQALINTKYNIGDVSEDIRSLQQCLRTMGLFNWPSNTGYFGEITSAAQKQAQSSGSAKVANPAETTATDNSCASLKTQGYSLGETSDRVKLLQGCMRAIGLFNYPSDTGYFGPVTQASLKSWLAQGSAAATPATSPVVASASNCDTVKQQSFKIGDTDSNVVKLQECLRSAGLFNWPTNTGYFGPVTAEALAKYKGTSAPQFSCAELKGQTWNFGETSSRVKQLQDCMTASGNFKHPGGSTGYFGEVTKAAIISWRGYF
jgi:peptidoglycan hydrolase-like protein with peptidoglycan-binding domain